MRKYLILPLLFVAAVFGFSVYAATTVTDVYDLPTALKISQTSNHKIVITLSEEIAEGETITIIFPSSFDTSSIIENDVDVADDSVDLTTAADCSGTENASVEVASDVVTITICAGDGGTVASGSQLIIEIGTNAAASGSGTNKITNPSSAGTYFAGIAGTSGMSGSIPIPIVADDDSGVSAIVSGGGGGGGGGGGAGGGAGDTGSTDTTTTDTTDTVTDTTTDTTDTTDTATDTTDTSDTTDTTTDDGAATDSGTISDGVSDSGTSSDSGSTSDSSSGSSSGDSANAGNGSGLNTETENADSSAGSKRDDPGVSIIVADQEINLGGNSVEVIPDTLALLRVVPDDSDNVESVIVSIGETNYDLVEVLDGVYETKVIVPSSDSAITVLIDYSDGSSITDIVGLDSKPLGWVYEIVDGERKAITGAVVIVYESSTPKVQWDAIKYGQSNPVVVGETGGFSWYVPNGTYIVTAGKSGYKDSQVTVRVYNNILTTNIELTRLADEVIIDEIITQDAGVIATVEQAVDSTIEAVMEIAVVLDEIRNLPQVQTAADVARPVIVASAIGSAGVLSSSFNLLNFIRYLFSSPILFFARRKRRQFGIIYNAITKVPLDLAIVRLYSESGKLLKTMVTDKEGRYFFKINPGKYQIKVTKQGFDYPSDYLKGKKDDGKYLDVYTGGIIEVTDKNVVISANIPLDPTQSGEYQTPKKLIISRFLRVLQHILALSGLILAIIVVIISPTLFSFGLLVVHVFVYLITRILARSKKKKGWGIVSAVNDGNPVANTVVRLFEPKYNKLIESTLTDGKGRYAFLAGPNEYFVTFERAGFERQEVRPIDFTKNAEPKVISVDVKLKQKVV